MGPEMRGFQVGENLRGLSWCSGAIFPGGVCQISLQSKRLRIRGSPRGLGFSKGKKHYNKDVAKSHSNHSGSGLESKDKADQGKRMTNHSHEK